jgi:hypothetical protein
VLLSADCPCADTDAPLATIELVAACLRFARDGDVGACGRDGGVRVPLAAMVMVKREACDSRCARCRWRGTRSERPKSLRVVGLLHQHSLCREEEDSPCNFEGRMPGS